MKFYPSLRATLALMFVCTASCLPLPSFAHDEAPEKEADDWKGSVQLGFNFTDGNSETSLINFGATASREVTDNIWRFEAQHSFGEQEDETNIDRTAALGEYKWLWTDRFYGGLGLEYLRNDIADVKYRATALPFLGYFLIKDKDTKFNVQAGPGYIFEEVGGVEDDYLAPRIGERLEHQISETAKLFQEATITFDVNDGDNYLINGTAGLEAALIGKVNLVLSVVNLYDNVPAEGRERNDLQFISGLSYTY